jgi:hypothetical protein
LKIGAEVMFIKNDSTGRYVNGTRCVVVGFDKSENGWPIVKTYDNRTIIANSEDWKFEDNGIVRATITQVPLRLAWAITIHKSQGMTLDAAEMDLGDAFEPGMGYVALSRVRSLNGLKLMNLNEMALKVHPRILDHDKAFKAGSSAVVAALLALSSEEIEQCQNETLLNRFDGSKTKLTGVAATIAKKKKAVSTHMTTLTMLKEKLTIEAIAEQRQLSVGTIITHLEKLKGLKLLDHAHLEQLRDKVPAGDFDVILAELALSDDGSLKTAYENLGGKYSYASIKLVRLFV